MSNINEKFYTNIENDIDSDFLNFGYGLFETMKIFNGNIELIDNHLERLNNSYKKIFQSQNINIELIKKQLCDFVVKNNYKDGALKIIVFENNKEYKYIIKYSNRIYSKDKYIEGFKLKISNNNKNEKSILAYHKTTNYMESIIEKRLALSEGFDECIYTNTSGNISEGTSSNIFIVKEGLLYTPPLSSGILNGIIRKFLIENLSKVNINVIEKDFELYELIDADEVFVTNSLMRVMPVNKVDNYVLSVTKNFITKKIIDFVNKELE